jgi:hypothetical protein
MSARKNNAFLSVSIATVAFFTLGAPSPARAQNIRSSVQAVARRAAAESHPSAFGALSQRPRVGSSGSLKSPRQSSVATKASIIALAALGGFAGGGIAGAAMENVAAPCKCDDPGLIGFVIGAPAGAVVGGLLGFHLTR